jgi:prepilin-type N-terminal cleavage/methylation domain-containing protein
MQGKLKNQLKIAHNLGFTLMELLVVVSIMVILASIMVLNLAGQRASRDLKIAQNELVSNIRKTQSYTLSSRILPNGDIAQYYLLKFDLSQPTQYSIVAISNVSSAPRLQNVETINLPPNIQIASATASSIYAVTVSRSLNPVFQPTYTNCALLAFAAPYGKVIFNDGCTPVNPASNPYALALSDDYYAKIINFQTNVPCDGNNGNPPNPAVCSASTDSIMTITLSNRDKTISKTVIINGTTGSVSFN